MVVLLFLRSKRRTRLNRVQLRRIVVDAFSDYRSSFSAERAGQLRRTAVCRAGDFARYEYVDDCASIVIERQREEDRLHREDIRRLRAGATY
jgi:hypothetical protein